MFLAFLSSVFVSFVSPVKILHSKRGLNYIYTESEDLEMKKKDFSKDKKKDSE